MQTVATVGLDIASVFQVHCVDAAGQVVFRRQLKRRYVLKQIPVKVVHNLHAESTPHIGLLGGS